MFIIAIIGSVFLIAALLMLDQWRNRHSHNAKIDRLKKMLDDFDELEELILMSYFKREIVNSEQYDCSQD